MLRVFFTLLFLLVSVHFSALGESEYDSNIRYEDGFSSSNYSLNEAGVQKVYSQQNSGENSGILQNILGRLEVIESLLQELLDKNKMLDLQQEELFSKGLLGDDFFSTKEGDLDGESQHDVSYKKALELFSSKKYLDSENAFAEFINTYPDSKLLSNAYFWYAETFYFRKIYSKALSLYLQCYKKFPTSDKAPDSLLRAVIILGELNKVQDACKLLDKLDSEFPNRSSQSFDISDQIREKLSCTIINR